MDQKRFDRSVEYQTRIGSPSGKAPRGRKENPMHDWKSLSHVRWECKYHVVIIPKYRQKVFYGKTRARIGPILRDLCRQRGVEVLEGHCMPDHVHLCLSIPPKYSVANTVGFLKGKSAIKILDMHSELKKRYWGRHFLAKRYCVGTTGLDEEQIRKYVRWQFKKDNTMD